jgi:hypothetical protein
MMIVAKKTKSKTTQAARKRRRTRAIKALRKIVAEAKPEASPGKRRWGTLGIDGLPVHDTHPGVPDLLRAIRAQLPALKKLLDAYSGHWNYEDPVYRFYHQSWKVYGLQDATRTIVTALQDLMPDRKLNDWFVEIVTRGTDKEWMQEHNKRWVEVTAPMVEAFFHSRYFLDMAVRYGQELKRAPALMPSGWAALLYLYNLR